MTDLKQIFRMPLILLLIFVGFKAARHEMEGQEIGVFSMFDAIPFLFLVLLTGAVLIIDLIYYVKTRKIYQLASSFAGLGFCLFILFKKVERNSIDNSKTLLIATSMAKSRHTLTFEFKEKNRFLLTEYQLFGQILFHGKYQREGDTLRILSTNYKEYKERDNRRGLIRNDTVFWNHFDTMLLRKEE